MANPDTLTRFLIENTGVRGVLVSLDATWREIRQRADYPPAVAHLLGEAAAPAVAVPKGSAGNGLDGYDDYMQKEIAEQADVASRLVNTHFDGCVDGGLWRSLGVGAFDNIQLLGCGTSLEGFF